MAALPKKKISKVRSKTRRAHWHATLPTLVTCAKCKAKKPSHLACPECGYYGKAKVWHTKADKKIAEALRLQAKQARSEAKSGRMKTEKPITPKEAKKIIQNPKAAGSEYQGDE